MSGKNRGGQRRYGNPANRRPMAGDLARLMQPSGIADPRRLGGTIAGPGGSHDRGAVFLDTTDAILLEQADVSTVDTVRDGALGGQVIFLTLEGR